MKTCQWIYGDPLKPGWHFCDNEVTPLTGVWCLEHFTRVYQVETRRPAPRQERKEAA